MTRLDLASKTLRPCPQCHLAPSIDTDELPGGRATIVISCCDTRVEALYEDTAARMWNEEIDRA